VEVEGNHYIIIFFSEKLVTDAKHGALLFTLLVTMLKNTDKEHEQQFIYDALKEGIKFMPQAFSVIESILFPIMSDVLQKSQNLALIEAIHSILQSSFHYHQQQTPEIKTLNRSFLNEIGFHRLPECASFVIDQEVKREVTKLVILLLENILKEMKLLSRERASSTTI